MTADAGFDPLAIVRALVRHDAPYIVVGGFAVAAHKVVRATRALDLVTERSWSAASRLAEALVELEARATSEPSVRWAPEVLVRPINLRIATAFGQIHLLNATSGVPPYPELDRTIVTVDGVGVVVASLAALRAMKHAAGRPKDLVDLAELDAVHGPEGD